MAAPAALCFGAFLVNIGLNLIFIRAYGFLGAPVATTTSRFLFAASAAILAAHSLRKAALKDTSVRKKSRNYRVMDELSAGGRNIDRQLLNAVDCKRDEPLALLAIASSTSLTHSDNSNLRDVQVSCGEAAETAQPSQSTGSHSWTLHDSKACAASDSPDSCGHNCKDYAASCSTPGVFEVDGLLDGQLVRSPMSCPFIENSVSIGNVMAEAVKQGMRLTVLKEYLRLAIPGGFMVSMEASSFDVTTIFAGTLGVAEVRSITYKLNL
jgi:hypothetical protein